jgi:hypothetical protein
MVTGTLFPVGALMSLVRQGTLHVAQASSAIARSSFKETMSGVRFLQKIRMAGNVNQKAGAWPGARL